MGRAAGNRRAPRRRAEGTGRGRGARAGGGTGRRVSRGNPQRGPQGARPARLTGDPEVSAGGMAGACVSAGPPRRRCTPHRAPTGTLAWGRAGPTHPGRKGVATSEARAGQGVRCARLKGGRRAGPSSLTAEALREPEALRRVGARGGRSHGDGRLVLRAPRTADARAPPRLSAEPRPR